MFCSIWISNAAMLTSFHTANKRLLILNVELSGYFFPSLERGFYLLGGACPVWCEGFNFSLRLSSGEMTTSSVIPIVITWRIMTLKCYHYVVFLDGLPALHYRNSTCVCLSRPSAITWRVLIQQKPITWRDVMSEEHLITWDHNSFLPSWG